MRWMRPFPIIAAGLALVVFDFRAGAVDLAFDPVGWLLVAFAAWQLSLTAAAWVSGVAAVLSVSDAFLPFHYIYLDLDTDEVVDPGLGEAAEQLKILVFDPSSGLRLAAMASAMVAASVAIWLLLTGLAQKAQAAGADRTAAQFRLLRLGVLGLWALPYLAAVASAVVTDGSFDPVWNDEAEWAVFVGLVPFVWLGWLLLTNSGDRWTFPETWARPSPWAELRRRR